MNFLGEVLSERLKYERRAVVPWAENNDHKSEQGKSTQWITQIHKYFWVNVKWGKYEGPIRYRGFCSKAN